MSLAEARRAHRDLFDEVGARLGVFELNRQDVGDGGSRVPALRKRAAPAERQQASAALVHEVGDHALLVRRERGGLDAAQHQAPVREQLVARLRKSAGEVLGRVDVEAQELAVRRALQHHDLQVRVAGRGPAQELHFEPRLALDVEHALAPVRHRHQSLAHVVLRHLLAVLRANLEAEDARPRLGQREPDTHGGGFAVRRQRHVLRRNHLPLVFDRERNGAAGVAGLAHHDLGHERGALEHGGRGIDAADLHVLVERLAPEADREHGQAGRFERANRVSHRLARRVGAVSDEHDTRDRQAGELLGRSLQRAPDVRARAGEGHRCGVGHSARGRGELVVADREPARQGGAERARGAQRLPDKRAAGLCVEISDLHAARPVHQDREHVALRLDGAHDEHRPKQGEQEDGERRETEREQGGAGPAGRARGLRVHPHRGSHRREDGNDRNGGRPGRAETQFTLTEHHRAVLEDEFDEPVEHDHLMR